MVFTANSLRSSTDPAEAEELLQFSGMQPQHLPPETQMHTWRRAHIHTHTHTLTPLLCLASTDSHPSRSRGACRLPLSTELLDMAPAAIDCRRYKARCRARLTAPKFVSQALGRSWAEGLRRAVLSWDETPAERWPFIMTSACYIIFFSPLRS